jgi:hypothetical protein
LRILFLFGVVGFELLDLFMEFFIGSL